MSYTSADYEREIGRLNLKLDKADKIVERLQARIAELEAALEEAHRDLRTMRTT